jgi:hypothetical protein
MIHKRPASKIFINFNFEIGVKEDSIIIKAKKNRDFSSI